MLLLSIEAATAVSVCLIPNPLMKALIRVMMNTITWVGDDDEEDDDEGNHQDNVVQDLCACMAVLVVDVDHCNQKE